MKTLIKSLVVAALLGLLACTGVANAQDAWARTFGVKCDGTTDDAAALQKALNAHSVIRLPDNVTCAIGSTLTLNASNALIASPGTGPTTGATHTGTRLKWIGAIGTGPMVLVPNAVHNTKIEGLFLDGNSLANVLLEYRLIDGGGIQSVLVRDVALGGYRTRGVLVGPDNIAMPACGQTETMRFDRVRWIGPAVNGDGTGSVIGMVYNALCGTSFVGTDLVFDPNSNLIKHDYHIYGIRTGIFNIFSMVSARSNVAAIYLGGPINIDGWYSEDRYLVRTANMILNGPTSFKNVYHGTQSALAGDIAIDWNGSTYQLLLDNVDVQGDIRVGNASAASRPVSAHAVNFSLAGARWRFPNGTGDSGNINTAIVSNEGLRTSAYTRANIANGANATVITNRPLDAFEYETIQVVTYNANTLEAWYDILVYRASTTLITMASSTRYENFTATFTLTDNGNGTYNLRINNTDAHVNDYVVKFTGHTIAK